MRRSSRVKRIDYQLLNNLGVRHALSTPNLVENTQLTSPNTATSSSLDDLSTLFHSFTISEDRQQTALTSPELVETNNMAERQLIRETICMAEDIEDFIDENEVEDQVTIDDINNLVKDIEKKRSEYRLKNQAVKDALEQDYDGSQHMKSYEQTLGNIKNYQKKLKEVAKQMKIECHKPLSVTASAFVPSAKPMSIHHHDFAVNEVERTAADIIEELDVDISSLTDQDVKTKLKKISDVDTKIERLSTKIKSLYKDLDSDDPIIPTIRGKFDEIVKLKKIYEQQLNEAMVSRDIDREDAFKPKLLNISIPRFKGHNSSVDFYTFKSEFNKLHERSTPSRLQPDLLKSNYLEDPALSLVNHSDDIEEIWTRLQAAYGEPKSLLAKKLGEVSCATSMQNASSERLAEDLGKLISGMKDLMKLATEHNIEEKLYNGDGISLIYNILGEKRMTRWLNSMDQLDVDDRSMWSKLIIHLEKEVQVEQQKLLLSGKLAKPLEENKPKSSAHNTTMKKLA